jgi:hypothetical protein
MPSFAVGEELIKLAEKQLDEFAKKGTWPDEISDSIKERRRAMRVWADETNYSKDRRDCDTDRLIILL